MLGALYFINNIADKDLTDKCRRAVRNNTILFLVLDVYKRQGYVAEQIFTARRSIQATQNIQ